MTGKIGSTYGNACPRHDDSREREAAGRRDLDHHLFLPSFTDGEVERRDPEGARQSPWKTSMSASPFSADFRHQAIFVLLGGVGRPRE